jgi:predicted secreted Zn-dependent protease
LRALTLAAFAACILFTGQAEAKSSTTYKTYTIAGDTAGEVLISMIRRGPTVGGVKAYATTLADFRQRGDMIGNRNSCKVRKYDFDGKFVITLPALKNERALTGQSRQAWEQFSVFLKRHEETHRAMWEQCSAEHIAAVKRISAKTCSAVERKARELWNQTRERCRKRHDRFDAAEQQALFRQPLVRMAIGSRAVVQKKPRKSRFRLRGL